MYLLAAQPSDCVCFAELILALYASLQMEYWAYVTSFYIAFLLSSLVTAFASIIRG